MTDVAWQSESPSPQPSPGVPGEGVSTAVSAALLLTSIAWITLWIIAIIVGIHAESLRKIAHAPVIITLFGSMMVLIGGLGAWVATDELAGTLNTLLLFASIWIWLVAIAITAGGLLVHKSHHWPIPELLAGVALSAIMSVVVAIRGRKSQDNAT